MSNVLLQIERQMAGTVAVGGNVIFDTTEYTSGNVTYDDTTGIITFNEQGRYIINWWVATQASPSLTGISFALSSSQGDSYEGASPIKTGEVVGMGIIDVSVAPVTVSLENTSGGTVFYSTIVPVQAALMIAQDNGAFEWGAQPTIIWADSSASAIGNGTPFAPYNSLQAAVTAAATSTFADTYGMRARCIVFIAANSIFDEDIIIPPARHIQLLGLGPWVLGDAALANFASSVPRNITIQTNSAEEDFYQSQGPAYVARPVTVVGTFDNGTSVSTHTNYTDGVIISGSIIFQNTDPVDPFTTIEFQLLNGRVVGSIRQDISDPHQGILNTYIYNSRVNIINHNGLRIQRMVDCLADGEITVAAYSHITNTNITGNVTIGTASSDVPPTGIFSSQFSTITWTGPLVLDTASNYYFVNSGSTLVGSKTVLFSLA